ncbi:DNA-binding FadR family transcriptional regulator [Amaricoccus macauensis]|uniref:DNA-binding FadR family transcriptional regulator n=1 Tax=Amaricoccus macauensis TaxID=57001 RepID=A0A840SN22_9RHOB|nr:DNA-binding FadR family transcriptional regulator [Amaricoccus macauensis]
MRPISALKRPPSLHVSVQESLRSYIAENHLEAGAPLPAEGDLAQQLGVSRNSVRESIKALESVGVLEVRRGSGVFVKAFSFEPLLDNLTYGLGDVLTQIENVVAVRRALELGMIDRTLEQIEPEDIRDLRTTLGAMRDHAERGEAAPEADRQFHVLLFRCLDNAILTRLIEVFWLAFYRASNFTDLTNPDPLQTWRDHVAIVDAIEARDLASVRDQLDRHYQGIMQVIAFNKFGHSNGREL